MKTKKNNPDKGFVSGITVNINVRCDAVNFDRRKVADMAKRVASRFGVKKARINFVVVDDEEIIGINRQFLNKNKTTDVISFDISGVDSTERLFDIVINAQMAQKQAKLRGHSCQAELALYFLHGLLHNLSFDDFLTKDAAKMHKTEDEILEEFGYGKVFGC